MHILATGRAQTRATSDTLRHTLILATLICVLVGDISDCRSAIDGLRCRKRVPLHCTRVHQKCHRAHKVSQIRAYCKV